MLSICIYQSKFSYRYVRIDCIYVFRVCIYIILLLLVYTMDTLDLRDFVITSIRVTLWSLPMRQPVVMLCNNKKIQRQIYSISIMHINTAKYIYMCVYILYERIYHDISGFTLEPLERSTQEFLYCLLGKINQTFKNHHK